MLPNTDRESPLSVMFFMLVMMLAGMLFFHPNSSTFFINSPEQNEALKKDKAIMHGQRFAFIQTR